MTCKHCALPGCEVIVVGRRDLCARHFGMLSEIDQRRLDELCGDGREVYRVTLEAMVVKIGEKIGRRAIVGVMGRASGYPSGPGAA